MRGIDDEHIDAGGDERLRALDRVGPDADRGADAQAAALVLRRVRVLDLLLDVLDGDEPAQLSVGVDDRQLLDLVPAEDRPPPPRASCRSGAVTRLRAVISADTGCCDVVLEAQVAVGEDADEDAVLVGDRDAGDLVAGHQLERLAHERVGRERDGLDDHPRLGALHLVDLGDLILDREVAVDDADAALARERDREPRLGDRVHRRRDDRDAQLDRARQPRARRDVVREHVRLGRNEEDVVERQSFLRKLAVQLDEALELSSYRPELDAQKEETACARTFKDSMVPAPRTHSPNTEGLPWRAMRMLFAALGLAAIVVQTAAAAPRPETLYTSPRGPIAAFAQDGKLLAWFARGAKGCNTVWVLDLATSEQVTLPQQSASAVNVTCDWDVVPPVRLRSDGNSATALWTLRELTPLRFDYLIGASFRNRLERRFQEIAHAARGAGLWLGGIAGDSDTLVYSVTSVDFADEVKCLSTPKAPHACAMRVGNGGGVYRVTDRTARLIPGTAPGGMYIALAQGKVAYIRASAVATGGAPLSAAEIDVRTVKDGKVVAEISPQGTPTALALSTTVIATLERRTSGLRLRVVRRKHRPADGLRACRRRHEPRALRERRLDRLPHRPHDSRRRPEDPQGAHGRARGRGADRPLHRRHPDRLGRERQRQGDASAPSR